MAVKMFIALKVDNSVQPNSRWYSGSGIYRNVWLVTTNKIAIDHWGTYIATPEIKDKSAQISLHSRIKNYGGKPSAVTVKTTIYNAAGKAVAAAGEIIAKNKLADSVIETDQHISVKDPVLWSVDHPYLYKTVTQVLVNNQVVDEYSTPLGIRYFNFDVDKGFTLNGKHLKILGVCDHHDLGSLGSAINTRALQRQLEILKEMGCNAIRTSHNPPAPELLDLCDKMGFIVMDEAFDCWEWQKVKYDYHLYFKSGTNEICRTRYYAIVITQAL